MKTVFIILLVVLFPVLVMADVINVPSTEYSTIQDGVSAANSGDTVLLASGTYTGAGNYNVSVTTQSITVLGEGNVTIDCDGRYKAFVVNCWPGSFTLENVSIVNGSTTSSEGILHIEQVSWAVVRNCVFSNSRGNSIYGSAGGIVVNIYDTIVEDSLTLVNGGSIFIGNIGTMNLYNTEIRNNVSSGNCAGLFVDNSTVTVNDCRFYGNSDGASILTKGGNSNVGITNCVFYENSGARPVFNLRDCNTTLTNVTVAGNQVSTYIFGVYSNAHLNLNHSIVWGNGGYSFNVDGSMSSTCSDFPSDSPQGDNISEDPMFCDMNGGNFELDASSLCLTSPCGQIGAFGLGCYGVVATEHKSWGDLKSLYR